MCSSLQDPGWPLWIPPWEGDPEGSSVTSGHSIAHIPVYRFYRTRTYDLANVLSSTQVTTGNSKTPWDTLGATDSDSVLDDNDDIDDIVL
ncbi:hypothetical protein E0Z10_g5967 [Xylaria hypoxylon]|uniref:Uncharacterized protein n=1 Tax=Xylaria hypoxylon TaxID=37992 RepID=A0A4Z0YWG2_9PEZI|nr:hypothetical protein E0Z10_g5967 [Xylaria hypoxylon]